VQVLSTTYNTKQLNIYHPLIRAASTGNELMMNIRVHISHTSPKVRFSVVPPLHLNFAPLRRVESCRELIPRYKITTALLHWNKNRIEHKERKIPRQSGLFLIICVLVIEQLMPRRTCVILH